MITQEIKLYEEPQPVTYNNNYYGRANSHITQQELDEAILWAKMYGLTIGTELRDELLPEKKMKIVGYKETPSAAYICKGKPAVIVVENITPQSTYHSAYSVDELLDKRYQYVNINED